MRMKQYIYASLFLLTGAMTSCDDILDAPTISSTDESVVFASYDLAENAVLGITNIFGGTNYRGRFCHFFQNTDMEWYNNPGNNDTQSQLASYSATSNNDRMNVDNSPWAMMYEGIEQANLCIRGLEAYADLDDPDFQQLLGEALTYRAIFYADLIKLWGDVPGRFEPITNETIYMARTDRDSIYARLLDDLARAEEMVAWPNATTVTSSVERISKSFVKGLRARIALHAGGYSQRADGTIRLSNDSRLAQNTMWQIARDECVSIIDQGCNTLGGFKQTFQELMAENLTAGRESLWEIPYTSSRGRVMRDWAVPHENADAYTNMCNGGYDGPTPIAFYRYDPEDVRRNVTCVPYYWENGIQVPNSVHKWYLGKFRHEWMSRVVSAGNDDGMNWIYMRLADVYLMAAEAINELEGPTNAAQYLRPILERAFPDNDAKVEEYMSEATASQSAFREAIIEQRGLEFCGEIIRKFDLIRWNRLTSTLVEARSEMYELFNKTGKYANLPDRIYYQTISAETPYQGVGNVFDDIKTGETVEIYGLELGQTDDEGAALNFESNKGWTSSSSWEDKILGLYRCTDGDPDQHQFWPIFQIFIDNSNGMLVNYENYQ